MTHGGDRLRAGEPMLLPSGRALLVIERTRMTVRRVGGWRAVFVQREPHALMLREADGSFSLLAAGSEPISMAAWGEAVSRWQDELSKLASAGFATAGEPPPR